MNRKLVVLLVMVSVGGLSRAATCANDNPYIKLLKSSNVMLFPTPQFNTTSCGLEWKTFGTCCQLSTLTTAVLADVQDINVQKAQMVTTLAGILKGVPTLKNYLVSLRKMPKYRNHKAALEKLLSPLLFFLGKPMPDINRVQASSDQCWTTMTKLRSASVCTTCSGRSQVFFRNNKALISEDICQTVITSCNEHFLILAQMSELAKKLYLLQQYFALQNFGDKQLRDSNMAKLDRLVKLFCNGENSFGDCHNVVQMKQPNNLNTWLCSNFVRLRERTLVSEINPFLRGLTDTIDQKHKLLVLKVQPPPVTEADPNYESVSPPSRSPGAPGKNPIEMPEDPGIVHGDPVMPGSTIEGTMAAAVNNEIKIMKPSDNMFNAVAGDGHFTPALMNLTMAFP